MTAEPGGGVGVAAWVAHEESRPDRRELVAGRLVLVQGASDRHDTTLYDPLRPSTTGSPDRSAVPGAGCIRTTGAS